MATVVPARVHDANDTRDDGERFEDLINGVMHDIDRASDITVAQNKAMQQRMAVLARYRPRMKHRHVWERLCHKIKLYQRELRRRKALGDKTELQAGEHYFHAMLQRISELNFESADRHAQADKAVGLSAARIEELEEYKGVFDTSRVTATAGEYRFYKVSFTQRDDTQLRVFVRSIQGVANVYVCARNTRPMEQRSRHTWQSTGASKSKLLLISTGSLGKKRSLYIGVRCDAPPSADGGGGIGGGGGGGGGINGGGGVASRQCMFNLKVDEVAAFNSEGGAPSSRETSARMQVGRGERLLHETSCCVARDLRALNSLSLTNKQTKTHRHTHIHTH
jgi:hypothetical protein